MTNMGFLKVFLPMLLIVVVILFVYNVLKIYVLDKIKVNKWVMLVITILVFFIPNLLWGKQIQNTYWQYIHTGVFLIFFLWFLDLAGLNNRRAYNKSKEGKNGTIRAKAKPSRVNNADIEVISDSKKAKKKMKKK
ncbi:hypothetical protein Z966_08645 [Clostridium novyi A str. NCTC 538]|nr:hypothetical protein Z967_08620 [Clostridium novyi A str. 4540]KEH88058.1 hypothetical protein Z966_08645 [Clostridium novyi A str. NCTC 538]KEH91835.1 hypothetical protein Z963_08150 [Clostridium botulinum C/D str. It1]